MGLFEGNNDDNNVKKFNEEMLNNRFSTQLNRINDTFDELWKDASDEPRKFFGNVIKHSSGKLFETGIFDSVWLNATDTLGDLLSGMGLPGGLSHPFKVSNMLRHGNDIMGLYRFKTPSATQYTQCTELGGLSVWDTEGWWKCLFPEAVALKHLNNSGDISQVLTREKVESDHSHRYGLFFRDYTGYLSWKSYMLRLSREHPSHEKSALSDFSSSTPEDLMSWSHQESKDTASPCVIGTSKYTTYNSNDFNQEKIVENRIYYDDGTVKIQSEKKIIPADGSDPTSEIVTRVVDKDHAEDESNGWFWKK